MQSDAYTGVPVPREGLTLGRFVENVAATHGPHEAMVFGDRRVTYRQLADDVRSAARAFIAAGVTKGSKVALLLGNRPEFVVAAHAAAAVGGVVVPVSTFAPAPERDYVLAHSDASLLVLQAVLARHTFRADLLAAHPALGEEPVRSAAFPHLRRLVCLGEQWDSFIAAGEQVSDDVLDAAMASVHPCDDSLIIYTSGTTANPKAVLHNNRTPVLQAWRWAEQLRLTPHDRVWSTFPFFWTAGLAMVVGGTLASGACLVMQEVFDAGEALELLERERVTTAHAWPHVEAQLTEHPDIRTRDLSSLTKCGTGLRQHVPAAQEWGTRAGYGLTETFTINSYLPADAPAELRATTHGTPLPGIEIRIVDDAGEPLPADAIGEIAVRGVTLMKGYYKTFPEDVFDAAGYFRTGDSGSVDSAGYLHWTGRLSGLIKTSGANVSPVEVEQKLADWGRLEVASVVGVPHPVAGEAVVLCAVERDDDTVSVDDVITFLRSVVASYKVPRRVLFFSEPELPYTGSQKVNVPELRRLAAQRIADGDPDDAWRSHLKDSQDD